MAASDNAVNVDTTTKGVDPDGLTDPLVSRQLALTFWVNLGRVGIVLQSLASAVTCR